MSVNVSQLEFLPSRLLSLCVLAIEVAPSWLFSLCLCVFFNQKLHLLGNPVHLLVLVADLSVHIKSHVSQVSQHPLLASSHDYNGDDDNYDDGDANDDDDNDEDDDDDDGGDDDHPPTLCMFSSISCSAAASAPPILIKIRLFVCFLL